LQDRPGWPMSTSRLAVLAVAVLALSSCNPFRHDSAVQVSAKDENLNSRWHANLGLRPILRARYR
jgi:hypothetical protein